MDGNRFDGLTKTLAAGASRRAVLRGALAGLAAAAGLRARGAWAAPAKQAFCHATGDPANPYVVIEVAEPAWDTHLAHGDTPHVDCCTAADCAAGQACTDGRCQSALSGCVPAGAFHDLTQMVRVGPLPDGDYLITDTDTGASKAITVPYFGGDPLGSDTFLIAGLQCPEDLPFYTGPLITFGGATEDGAQVVHLSVFDPNLTTCSGRAACFTITPL